MANDIGHWECDFEFNPDEWFGFIYRIIEIETNREYIGKKQFTKLKRKKIKNRANRKHVRSESNWKKYTSSSNYINESIEKNGVQQYRFIIESLHKTKGSLFYAEVKKQIEEDVMRSLMPDGVTRRYINRFVSSVKFIPPQDHPDEIIHRVKKI